MRSIFTNIACTSDAATVSSVRPSRCVRNGSVERVGGISKSDAGFTLIETFVAVTVLLLAVVGPLTIASRGLISAAFARDQITAYYLAQEAVEIIRNQRDNNTLAGREWTYGISSCFGTPTGCTVDARESAFTTCADTCEPLRRDESGYYSYQPSDPVSPFTRTIHMTDLSSGGAEEFSVAVTMSWKTGPLSKTFIIEDHFFSW